MNSVTKAARAAKIHRQNHYDWLEQSEEYRAAFVVAEKRGTRFLEDVAVQRAHEGLRREVRYKGRVVGYEQEYSNDLLKMLLRAGNPGKFGNQGDGGSEDELMKISRLMNAAPDTR